MGRDVPALVFTREDRRRYRIKMQECLEAFAQMLRESRFETERPQVGLEIELNLVDDRGEPAMRNSDALEAIADPAWSTELGRFNLEINIPPRQLTAGGPDAWETEIRAALNHAEDRAASVGAHLIMVGTLPTLRQSDVGEAALSENPRYRLLNDQVFAARGEDLHIEVDGVDRLRTYADTITPEAACTSTQFHLQVAPEEFPDYWNAAQAVAGVQVALAANSPFLLGKELWHESRIPLFEQATDTRPQEIKAQGVRPRVWFGERWINSVFDLFEENLRYFPALLPLCDEQDPAETLDRGDIPELGELTLHNGTIYRWNRPVYAVAHDKPHVRVENRVLPAGPTVADTLANGAFYYGLTRALVEEERPVWSRMSFSVAEDNLHTAARHGIEAHLYWPGVGEVTVPELVLRRLLPLAHRGLELSGMDSAWREPLLGIIEQRCVTGRNGAVWQKEMFHHIDAGTRPGRHEALRRMTRQYMDYMHLTPRSTPGRWTDVRGGEATREATERCADGSPTRGRPSSWSPCSTSPSTRSSTRACTPAWASRRPTGTASASAGSGRRCRPPPSSGRSGRPGATATCGRSRAMSARPCSSRTSGRRRAARCSRPTAIRSATAGGCGCTTARSPSSTGCAGTSHWPSIRGSSSTSRDRRTPR